MNDCDRIYTFDMLGAMTNAVTLFGYELLKIKELYNNQFGEESDRLLDVYGISSGAQLAIFASSQVNWIKNLILSGSMVFVETSLTGSITVVPREKQYSWLRSLPPSKNRKKATDAFDLVSVPSESSVLVLIRNDAPLLACWQ